MAFKTKAQAALEFLTTYGWAFLIILIMIGTLAYFGILNPSKLLPNRCNFGAEFQCLDYKIVNGLAAGDDTLNLRLKNSVGELIDVPAGDITLAKEDGTAYACTAPQGAVLGWKLAEIKDLAWSGCTFSDLASGQKGKMLITVRYNAVASGATYAREVQGEIFTNILSS